MRWLALPACMENSSTKVSDLSATFLQRSIRHTVSGRRWLGRSPACQRGTIRELAVLIAENSKLSRASDFAIGLIVQVGAIIHMHWC